MACFLCQTCGTQFADRETPPDACPICLDERQYVGPGGQKWVLPADLARSHRNAWRKHAPDLYSIETLPAFGIAQRAFLIRTPHGNILWDCLSLIDDATAELIGAMGGLAGIAISHPHYYSSMVEWARRFDCQVHLHVADRQWIMRPDDHLVLWDGETQEFLPGLTMIRTGGHYPGGCVLHWAAGSEGNGTLLSGDVVQVAPDRKFVSVMRSYPNMLPVSAPAIERLAAAIAPYDYRAIYGAFTGREILTDAKQRVALSLERYLAAIRGDGSAELA